MAPDTAAFGQRTALPPLICSSFRTRDKQEKLFSKKVQSYLNQGFSQAEAEEKAAYWVARHQ